MRKHMFLSPHAWNAWTQAHTLTLPSHLTHPRTSLSHTTQFTHAHTHQMDASMFSHGSDRTRLQELQREKDQLEPRLSVLYSELEALM